MIVFAKICTQPNVLRELHTNIEVMLLDFKTFNRRFSARQHQSKKNLTAILHPNRPQETEGGRKHSNVAHNMREPTN